MVIICWFRYVCIDVLESPESLEIDHDGWNAAKHLVFGDSWGVDCLFSPTAQATGVFSHSKGFGAERSSTKTHSPRFPNRGSQIEVPK